MASSNAQTSYESEKAPTIPIHRFAALNPFRSEGDEGGEELGEDLTDQSVAGGGRGTALDGNERSQLHVSHALRKFLLEQGEIKEPDVGDHDDNAPHSSAVQVLLERQPTIVPPGPDGPNDRSHPLSSYLISSSHNSYLVGNQLRGKTSAHRYTQILASGCRCVEIDAWDGDDDKSEPKVTHGMTLVEHITFRAAVEAIGQQMEREIAASKKVGAPLPLPIFISLENHCNAAGQQRLAAILHEVLGDLLVTKAVHADGADAKLSDLEGKVLVMVERYAREDGHEGKEEAPAKIVPELAALGVYAQSVKPTSDAWLRGEMRDPANPLLNIGEGALLELLEKGHADAVARHNAEALMRVYPAGTRITSHNLNPVPFWGVGAHVAALNCQTFDHSMQLQEAMFDGTDGWALKPSYLRQGGGEKPTGTTVLRLTVAGGSDLPVPHGRDGDDDIRPYVTCTLYHPSAAHSKPEKRKTSHYHRHNKLSAKLHKHESPPAHSPIWHHPETLEWEYEDDELVFLRILVKSDDRFSRNPVFAAAAVRVSYLQSGWRFLRLFNLRGEKTKGTLLVKFDVGKK